MYNLIKPLLFSMDPERAHSLTTKLITRFSKVPGAIALLNNAWDFQHPNLQTECMGLSFKNPVGLAAGFDKDAAYIDPMSALGFGFIEVGTVTPQAQSGNPKPRLFRLTEDRALINRMGFNNSGVDVMIQNLKKSKAGTVIVGGNIGKNKVTPNEKALEDYLLLFKKLLKHVDYFVVNVSSPNTPGLRALQEKVPLSNLLGEIQRENKIGENPKPILLKIAPDLSLAQLDDILDVVVDQGLSGIIATNTTIDRKNLKISDIELERIGPGGLSGAPLTASSANILKYIRKHAPADLCIISVGGIMTVDDAMQRLDNGANLLQIYTGLVYAGPTLVRDINKVLSRRKNV